MRTASEPVLIAVRRARDLIDRDFDQPIDLAVMARRSGYARHHFVRSFRAAYGETPRRYLSRRRIERAKELLRNTELTISETCVAVGFASLGSFSSRFHNLVGLSPTEYRTCRERSDEPPGCATFMWTRPAGD